MAWIRRTLRGKTVYVKATETGEPTAGADGRVEIMYQLRPGAKVYRASLRNLEPTGDPADERPIELESSAGATPSKPGSELPEDAIIVYTDGACWGNPGPCGIGVVILDKKERRELSEYLGEGTNNIAELTAIERALEEIPAGSRERPVLVHSDSSYSIGLLTQGWKAKKNVDLVARLRRLADSFPDLRLVKVRGHAGVPENERADELANDAVRNAGR